MDTQTKEDNLLIASAEDKEARTRERDVATNTGFLDLRQAGILKAHFKYAKHVFTGGYEDAERQVLVFLPDYEEAADYQPAVAAGISGAQEYTGAMGNIGSASGHDAREETKHSGAQKISGAQEYTAAMGNVGSTSGRDAREETKHSGAQQISGAQEHAGTQKDSGAQEYTGTQEVSSASSDFHTGRPLADLISVLRVHVPKGSKPLTHRDYLGSILSLGIDRSLTGDILVNETGADIIVLRSMAEFLRENYTQVGHTPIHTEIVPISELNLSSIHTEIKMDTVASLRLDNIIGSAFNLSRSKAQEAIKSGKVFVNSTECLKPDFVVQKGDKLVLRGLGKARLAEVGAVTRKDRIFIQIEKYV